MIINIQESLLKLMGLHTPYKLEGFNFCIFLKNYACINYR